MYSDCEHEIKPVTTGHRVTLTYNLYNPTSSDHSSSDGSAAPASAAAAASAARESAFGTQLSAGLSDPTWYPKGVTLGLVLEHSYAVKPLDKALQRYAEREEDNAEYPDVEDGDRASKPDNMPSSVKPDSLKGTDLQLYRAVHALGLEVKIVPIMSLNKLTATELNGVVTQERLPSSTLAMLNSFGTNPNAHDRIKDRYDDKWPSFWQDCLKESGAEHTSSNLVWVKPPGKQHLKYCGPVTEYQGNDGYVECFYAAAAVLLVVLPPVGSPARQG
jgi:hypothetical protein